MRGLGAIVNKSLKKELIINCKSDRQRNAQKKEDKRINNDLQNTT